MKSTTRLPQSLRERAQQLHNDDSLAAVKSRFSLPRQSIYLDGNSLGTLPVAAKQRAIEVVEQQWGEDLITSWNIHNWIELPVSTGEKIARLIGAAPGQTICCDSISVNLFKLLCAGLQLNPGRTTILSEATNFPTDLYMAQGIESLLGADKVRLKQVPTAQLEDALNDDVAVLMLTHVNFRCGTIHDMQALTAKAQAKGIVVIWDLAHSAGVLDLQLDDCNVDFAVGCGYKYLNGGPGAPAFMYVASRHQQQFQQPLSGWMGHAKPFDFNPEYQPAAGMEQCLVGTPAIISMSILDAALDVFADLSMGQVRAKSMALTDFFIDCFNAYQSASGFSLVSPGDAEHRGSQVALAHPQAYAICQALIAQRVIADFRAPNILRLGFSPLYTSFEDVLQATETLVEVMEQQTYLQAEFQQRAKVT